MRLLSRLRSRLKGKGRGAQAQAVQPSGGEDSASSTEPKPKQTASSHHRDSPLMNDNDAILEEKIDVQHLRDLLCERVPTELVDFREGNHVIAVHTQEPRYVHDEVVTILSVSFADPSLATLLRRVRRVELVIKGHDQGWSDFSVDHGTTRGAWTWYSLGTNDPFTHEGRLATNLHAVSETQTHGPYVWERDSKVVRMLQEAKIIEVWAHARFSGWVNHIEEAQIYIYVE